MSRGARQVLGPALALVLLGACDEPAQKLGALPADAQRHADEALGALARCFGPLDLEPALQDFRRELAAYALVPSRVADNAAWTRPTDDLRRVVFSGRALPGRYTVGVGATGPAPERPADYRGALILKRLGPGEFEWNARDELALGGLRVEDAGQALSAWLRLVERADEARAAADVQSSFPRTSALLGRAFTLDSLRFVAPRSGGRQLVMQATLRPELLSPTLPHYAAWLRGYVLPMRFRLALDDGDGVRFWDFELAEGRVTLRLRAQDGHVVPLAGAPRALPGQLRATTSFSTRSGMFRVGLAQLEADVSWSAASGEAGFSARFTKSPQWELPFLVQPFLRGSLRRPFEGEGALLAFHLRSAAARQTLVTRDYRLAVRESWMMRWLGGFASGAVAEFRREAEREADRYTGDILEALRADVVILAGAASATPPDPAQP